LHVAVNVYSPPAFVGGRYTDHRFPSIVAGIGADETSPDDDDAVDVIVTETLRSGTALAFRGSMP
jgi:hypothetical protein